MGKAVYKARDKMNATLVQSELKSEGIETIIVRDTSSNDPTAFISLLMGGNSDSGWQVVTHDEDVDKAIEFLKKHEDEISGSLLTLDK